MNGYNFTERVRKILAIAREQAIRLQADYVAPEHMLLGIAREGEGVAAAVLENLNADLDALSATIEGLIGPPKRDRASSGPDLPYTQRGKRTLEFAMGEARELNHGYVGSEHLLLGILRDETNLGAQALAALGVTLDSARAETLRLLGTPSVPAPPRPAVTRRPAPRATGAVDEQTAWMRLSHALNINERLGTPPTVTLEPDGTLTVPLGPDLLISVELPPGARLRRRTETSAPDAPDGSAQERE